MTRLGIDYAWSRPAVSTIVANGYGFVCRYLSWLPDGKVIDDAEVRALLDAGVDVFLNWEFDAQDALRGADGGMKDATEALRQARALGYPQGATIYHSADFDVTDAQKPIVAAYMVAARKVHHAAGYRTGCYSGYWTLRDLFDHGYCVDDGWQTFGWSGGLWEPRATIRQIHNDVMVGGAVCDVDEIVGATYSWLHPNGGSMTGPTPADGNALIWREKTIVDDAATTEAGPTAGEENKLHAHLVAQDAAIAALSDKLDKVLAALASTGGLAAHTHDMTGITGPAVPAA
jgi:hypothetical protein